MSNPIFHISPTFYSFAGQPRGATIDATVTVSNTGTAALTMGAMTGLSAPFSVVSDQVTDSTMNSSGDSSTFVLQYQPAALGASSGTLSISSNDSSSPYLFYVDGTSQAAVALVSPTIKHFGGVAENSTVDQTVTVTNIGNITLTVSTLSGLAAPYSLLGDNVSGHTFYTAGDTSTVVVRYHPTTIGVTSDTLVMSSNDPSTPYNFLVDGTSQEADISVSPVGIDFGLQTIGTSSSQTITVTNIGNIPLVVQPVSGLSAPFSVANDNVSGATIAPSGTATLSVVFNPSDFGYAVSHLIINSNDPGTPAVTVPVEGAGSEPVSSLVSTGVREVRSDWNRFEIRDYLS